LSFEHQFQFNGGFKLNLNEVVLRPLDPKCDFNSIAALMNTVETEPNTAESVAEWYAKKQDDSIWFTVAISMLRFG
jgi:uncharacterized ParB-like nuclease family protein